jgi:Amino acid synthesis
MNGTPSGCLMERNKPESLVFRKWYAFSEETLTSESGRAADGPTLWKHAVAAVVGNPFAGEFGEDLTPLVEKSILLGHAFGTRLMRLANEGEIEGYGKAVVVGTEGEYEHGNALVTSAFADPIRKIIGGGKAWIPSTGKRGGPGVVIDVPLAHKDALYVRSHYDTYTMSFADAPSPREIVVIFVISSRGRLNARLGGIASTDIEGKDGLR